MLALAEWEAGLMDFTEADIERGLSEWRGKWPPSLPEFQQACAVPTTMACHRPFLVLPRPKADRGRALAAIQAIRMKL